MVKEGSQGKNGQGVGVGLSPSWLGYVFHKRRELSEELGEGHLEHGLSELGQKVGCRQCTLTGEACAAASTVLPCVAFITAFVGSSWAGLGQATCAFVKGHFQ